MISGQDLSSNKLYLGLKGMFQDYRNRLERFALKFDPTLVLFYLYQDQDMRQVIEEIGNEKVPLSYIT